jgi:hypothetical protein
MPTCSGPCGIDSSSPVPGRSRRAAEQHARSAQQRAVTAADAERVQALVGRGRFEQLVDAPPVAPLEQVDQRLLQGGADQLRAHVDVAHRPAQHQRIDQRHHRIGERQHRDRQRHQETQRQANGAEHRDGQGARRMPGRPAAADRPARRAAA